MGVPELTVPDLEQPSAEVAPRLLGCRIHHAGVSVRLTEVEAYAGQADPASHAFRGRTTRNAVMYGPPGRLYVYFVYGMHWCANVVTDPDGTPGAVLLRAGVVEDGFDEARLRMSARTDVTLARGPAALATVLGLTGVHTGERAALLPPTEVPPVTVGPRVGLRVGVDTPWRFHVTGDPSVSAFRAGTVRRRTGP
jgi:DNA-3-methyladenine glycosylase